MECRGWRQECLVPGISETGGISTSVKAVYTWWRTGARLTTQMQGLGAISEPYGSQKMVLLLCSCSAARKRKVQDLGQVPHCLGDCVCSTHSIRMEGCGCREKTWIWTRRQGPGEGQRGGQRKEGEEKTDLCSKTLRIINTEKNSQTVKSWKRNLPAMKYK